MKHIQIFTSSDPVYVDVLGIEVRVMDGGKTIERLTMNDGETFAEFRERVRGHLRE